MNVGRVLAFVFASMMLVFMGAGLAQPGEKSGGADKPTAGAGEKIDKAVFTPGQVVEVTDADSGPAGFYLVYVPKDYVADKAWPVIVSISSHDPNVTSFRTAVKGSGYLVVGVQATDDTVDYEVTKIKRIMAALSTRLKIDSKRMMIAGTYQGGANAGDIAEASPDMWTGLVIIGSGKSNLIGEHMAGAGLAGKPVFVGTGDRDPARANLPAIVEHYRAEKADVTEATFKGGISIGNDESLLNWLTQSGSKAAKEAFEEAEKLEKAGKQGAAYTAFLAVEKIENAGNWSKMAKEQAAAIEGHAQDRLAAAIVLSNDGKYAAARTAFEAVATDYAGSTFAEQALGKVKEQDRNPAVAAAQQQGAIDAKADAAESAARTVESHGDLVTARAMYEKYVAAYPTATRLTVIKAHLDELKANPASTRPAATATEEMDKDCKGTMMLVDGYVKNGHGEKALPLLEEMIKKYPKSEWAKTAATKEAEIKKGL